MTADDARIEAVARVLYPPDEFFLWESALLSVQVAYRHKAAKVLAAADAADEAAGIVRVPMNLLHRIDGLLSLAVHRGWDEQAGKDANVLLDELAKFTRGVTSR